MKYENASLDQLEQHPNNIRKILASDAEAELLASLRNNGQYVALICYLLGERRIVIDGYRRLEAMKKLEWKTASICLLDKQPDAAELLIAQIHVNGRRQEVNPIDLLAAYQKLMELKRLTPTQLAAAIGVEPPKVTPILALGRLNEEQRELVRAGKIPLSTAYALARMDPQERDPCVRLILAGAMNRDQVHAKARRKQNGEQTKSRRVCCELSQGKVTVTSETGLSLSSLIELLDSLSRQCKKARANGWDISTAIRVLRDTANRTDCPHPAS